MDSGVSRFALVLAFAGAACASGPFVRPTPSTTQPPRIVDEATGRTFTDCRAAFAEATGETVLSFSAGVFRCGPMVSAASDFLIVRGAGLGHTFLDAGTSPDQLHLTAITPGKVIRVEDLAFGGLGPQPTTDSTATLVRTAVATDRPMLFGDGDGLLGTVMVVHSVLAKTTGQLASGDQYPKPVAYNGNERVAIVESVLADVEQEFERYPAPGSIELLDDQIQASFELHDPASGHRKDASRATNVTCGNKKSPQVVCAGQGGQVTGDAPVAKAAELLAAGSPLAELEAPLREAGRDFAMRFTTSLVQDVRQPDVFWFDDPQAKMLELESQLSGREADAALIRQRSADVLARCADPSAKMLEVLARAKTLDRMLPRPELTKACVDRIRPRAKALVDQCRTSLDWATVLAEVNDMDDALGDQGASVRECRDAMRVRANQLARTGTLAPVYLREVSRVLELGAAPAAATERASLATVSASLPWIVSRAGATLNLPANPSVVDLLIHQAMQPNSGDGRQLVDQTPGCKLAPVAPGAPAKKATGEVVLAEALPNAAPTDLPRVVLELPVSATVDDLPPGTDEGAVNVQLISACEAKEAAAYPDALRQYVAEELARQASAGNVRARNDAEVALFLVSGAAQGRSPAAPPKNVPLVTEALQVIQSELANPEEKLAVGTSIQPSATAAAAPVPKSTAQKAPDWTMDDLMRAADLVSRSGELNLAACAFLLSDVPWRIHETDITGSVTLEQVPTRLVCQTSPRGFQLSIWVDGPAPQRVRILAGLERAVTKRLGTPTVMATGYGPAIGWNATPQDRTAFVFRALPPADSMLGYLLVPLGSDWRYR